MGSARRGGCVIAAAPEAGAEVGAGLTFTLALISALMFVVLVGLKGGWKYTIGYLIEHIAETRIKIKWAPDIHPFRFLRSVNDTVLNALGDAAAGYEHAMGFWFHETARLQLWIAEETWNLARDTYHFGGWLVHTYVPTYVHGITDLLHTTTNTTTKVVRVTETKVIHLTKTVYVQAKNAAVTTVPRVALPHVSEWKWIHEHWKALTRAVAVAGAIATYPPNAIPRLWHGIDDLRKWRPSVAKRLSRVEGLLGATVLAAAMANVLGIRNPNCLRKGPIGKVARRLCGLSTTALTDLLSLLADVLLISEICDVLPYLEQGFNVIADPLAGWIGEAGAALCGGDFDPPPDLAIPALSIPAFVGATTVEV